MKRFYSIGFGLAFVAISPFASADLSAPSFEKKEDKEEKRAKAEKGPKDGGGGLSEKAKKDLEAAREKLRTSRDKRRDDEKAEQKAKYGDDAEKAEAKAELKQHAQRVARLHRIERIAKAEGKDAVAKRVADALQKEKKRHDKKMGELKAKKGDAAP